MKQNYTMYIYRADRRYKTGERLFSTTVWSGRTLQGMEEEMRALARDLYPGSDWRFEFHPTMKTVKNLMTGIDVEIPHNTPRACDPSSELYWTM